MFSTIFKYKKIQLHIHACTCLLTNTHTMIVHFLYKEQVEEGEKEEKE